MKTKLLIIIPMLFVCTVQGQVHTFTTLNSSTVQHLLGVSAIDANTTYVCGNGGTILKTTNGGSTWQAQVSGTSQDLYSIDFTDTNNGVAVGNGGTLLRTTNGGNTWLPINITTNYLRCIYFYDANTGYATGGVNGSGAYGQIFKTTNGGATWVAQTIISNNIIYAIKFTDALTGYACDYTGTIFKTINAGVSWQAQNSGTANPLVTIDFNNASNGIALGNTTITITTNSGNTWTTVTSPTTNYVGNVQFYDTNKAIAVGGNVANNTGTILTTSDGGTTWNISTPNTSRLFKIDFANSNLGYIVGLDGTILKYSCGKRVIATKDNFVINTSSNNLLVQPNPTSTSAAIDLTSFINLGVITLELFDITGSTVIKRTSVGGELVTIEKNNLASGLYIFKAYTADKIIGTGKLMFN